MTITTQFDAGEEVFIINNSSVTKAVISKVNTEKNSFTKGEPLITYHFNNPDGSNREFYRYESEVAGTVAELIRKLAPKEANPSANDADGGVTDDLVKLQKFVRDLATNYDCDEDAHRHKNGGCRTCNARALLII